LQISQFEHYLTNGIVQVYGSAEAASIANPDIGNTGNFTQDRLDLVVLLTIIHMRETLFDIKLDETVPPAENVLLTTQIPFLVKGEQFTAEGDKGVLIEDPYEESWVIDIPSGYYLLTVHQFYTGDKPLGPPKYPAVIESIRWDRIPICVRMYFNAVDSLEDIVPREHWNWPEENT
jgi:hypothetical protein